MKTKLFVFSTSVLFLVVLFLFTSQKTNCVYEGANTESGINGELTHSTTFSTNARKYKIVCLEHIDFSTIEDTMIEVLNTFKKQGVHLEFVFSGNIKDISSYLVSNTNGGYSTILDDQKFLNAYSNYSNVIFLTTKRMYDSKLRDYVRGYSTGVNVIVRINGGFTKETTIHELGHTLGLSHCNNLSCIMAVNNDAYDSGLFCNNCRRHLNY
jgi:hypothetical protein